RSSWLVNAQADTPAPPRLAAALYFAAVYGLVAVGTALGPRRFRSLMMVMVLAPLLVLGVAAFRLDLRGRYVAYMLPLVWMAVANAAWGAGTAIVTQPRTARLARALLFLAVASG